MFLIFVLKSYDAKVIFVYDLHLVIPSWFFKNLIHENAFTRAIIISISMPQNVNIVLILKNSVTRLIITIGLLKI